MRDELKWNEWNFFGRISFLSLGPFCCGCCGCYLSWVELMWWGTFHGLSKISLSQMNCSCVNCCSTIWLAKLVADKAESWTPLNFELLNSSFNKCFISISINCFPLSSQPEPRLQLIKIHLDWFLRLSNSGRQVANPTHASQNVSQMWRYQAYHDTLGYGLLMDQCTQNSQVKGIAAQRPDCSVPVSRTNWPVTLTIKRIVCYFDAEQYGCVTDPTVAKKRHTFGMFTHEKFIECSLERPWCWWLQLLCLPSLLWVTSVCTVVPLI